MPKDDGRVVVSNEYWAALVPWWAKWPFEILCESFNYKKCCNLTKYPVLPYHRHIESIDQLSPTERKSFSELLSQITRRYDNLFQCSFPYSMGIHQRPIPASMQNNSSNASQSAEDESNYAHLHLHFEPPLLRSATVKKFLVGFVFKYGFDNEIRCLRFFQIRINGRGSAGSHPRAGCCTPEGM